MEGNVSLWKQVLSLLQKNISFLFVFVFCLFLYVFFVVGGGGGGGGGEVVLFHSNRKNTCFRE